MARHRRGSASKVVRCRGRCESPAKPRRCAFLIRPPREYCRWHAHQAADVIGITPLHPRDGAITLAQLAGWAQVFDTLGEGESWPAGSFVDWLAGEQAAALRVAS